MSRDVINALTVDVEDWVQSVLDPDLPLTERFHANTLRVLELFDIYHVRATFFVLGLVAEKRPDLVRAIHGAGHEVASHGYGHRLVTRQSPAEFRADVDRSKKLLEDILGAAVLGYRAPAFSVVSETLWALDVLVETGYAYDSSIFPVRMRRYGINATPWHPHRRRTPGGAELIEVPVASVEALGRRWPIGGGGYLRLLPARMVQAGVARLNRRGAPATLYVHPYEFAPRELTELARDPALRGRIPWRLRLHQGLGRSRVAARLERILRAATYSTVADMLEREGLTPRVGPIHTAPAAELVAPSRAVANDIPEQVVEEPTPGGVR